MTRMGDREIRSAYGRLPDNPRVDCPRKVKHLLGTNKRIKSNKNVHLISWCDQLVFFC